MASERKRSEDLQAVENYFNKPAAVVKEHGIQPEDVWNMDETGFRIGEDQAFAMATSNSAASLISTGEELEVFISSISPSSTLYLDLEGKSLCRHGTISLITILLHPEGVVKLVDVATLGDSAFNTTSKDGKSLKTILEDSGISKCLWDLRNDADALWALYKVGLAGVIDLQLLENASRTGDKTYLCGLEKAIRLDLKLGFLELNRLTSTKKEITSLMSTNIFATRPLEPKTLQYCTNDVVYLPALHDLYLGRISIHWLAKAQEESSRRVDEVHGLEYDPQSPTKTRGPWGSGADQPSLTLDEELDRLDDYLMEQRAEELDRLDDFLLEERAEELDREMFGYDDEDYYDDGGPTNCRDIIDDCDYYLYYSD
ncbi:3-5 exonuclease [Triangularia setosa]|uniref:3-5 exonuclease n=1 Tax=Triangularia setosa TaxID=2587417 RepID=A0AAN6W692_9PEZI|nr:3-5 exonuclease [Podospora setosa]